MRSQTFVVNEIKDHLRAGFEVDVLSIQGADTADFPASELGSEFEGRIVYLNVPTKAVRKLEQIASNLLARPRHIRSIIGAFRAIKGEPLRARLQAAAVAARMLEIAHEYEIFHCHFGDVGRLVAIALEAAASRAKLATTFHGYDVTKSQFQPLDRYYRSLIARCDVLLPVNDIWSEKLVGAGFRPSNVVVHHMGVDTAELDKAPVVQPKTQSGFRVALVGRMVEKKGHEFALAALSELRARGFEIVADFVGDGPLRDSVTRLVARYGLADCVQMSGACDHPATLEKMRQADAIILPSVTARNGDMEGIPVVLMEAMAIGRPVISTRHSGIPELIEHGVSGLLVDERDARQLAEAMARLIEDPDLRTRLALGGRSKVEEGFDLEEQGRALRSIYITLLDH
ncbi:MAG TPA: glycosyltransferase [Allosphingosinicella sp.]|nr:glycosyltransferase [Allosphingosinicella sp.]